MYRRREYDGMIRNRLIYLGAVVVSTVFYIAYGEWISWFVLMWVLTLPWLSLLVSLPAMLTASVIAKLPVKAEVGEHIQLRYETACRFPAPPARAYWQAENRMTGMQAAVGKESRISAEFCGAVGIRLVRLRVCDYLGLFSFFLKKEYEKTVLILPVPLVMEEPPVLRRRVVNIWKPKAGSYSEDHDLRLYRPGDSLRLIHWKLTAKTGKLIYREPIEALRDKVVLAVSLSGTPEQLNDKFGQLLWLSGYLLDKGMPHEIRCITGKGKYSCLVQHREDTYAAVENLLQLPVAQEAQRPDVEDAYWHYYIGGKCDEA